MTRRPPKSPLFPYPPLFRSLIPRRCAMNIGIFVPSCDGYQTCLISTAWSDTGTASLAHTSCLDRKSTRLNSSHDQISYAVFCLKKKKNHQARNVQAPHTCSS